MDPIVQKIWSYAYYIPKNWMLYLQNDWIVSFKGYFVQMIESYISKDWIWCCNIIVHLHKYALRDLTWYWIEGQDSALVISGVRPINFPPIPVGRYTSLSWIPILLVLALFVSYLTISLKKTLLSAWLTFNDSITHDQVFP